MAIDHDEAVKAVKATAAFYDLTSSKYDAQLAGWLRYVADMADAAKRLEEQLREADEILTESGWHHDRGLLQRIRAVLASLPKDKP